MLTTLAIIIAIIIIAYYVVKGSKKEKMYIEPSWPAEISRIERIAPIESPFEPVMTRTF
jgi:hypothetical protein